MNITLPEKEKISKKSVILYVTAILICIISIIAIVYTTNSDGKTIDELLFEKTHNVSEEQEQQENLKNDFMNGFINQLENENNYEVKESKLNEEKPVIYTRYHVKKEEQNRYNLNINIPYINMDNEFANNTNKKIEEIFAQKARNILTSEEGNAIYSVKYRANIEDGILYLMIYSELKENLNAQRTIVQTYKYDLENQKEITLGEIIDKKGLDRTIIQNKVKQEIQKEQDSVEDLKELGYTIFERNTENDIYKLEYTQEFFVKDGKLYLIYAYGNENLTSEMDIVII